MYIHITSVDTNSKANLKKHKSFRDNTTQQHINTMSTEKCFYHKDLLIIFFYFMIFEDFPSLSELSSDRYHIRPQFFQLMSD